MCGAQIQGRTGGTRCRGNDIGGAGTRGQWSGPIPRAPYRGRCQFSRIFLGLDPHIIGGGVWQSPPPYRWDPPGWRHQRRLTLAKLLADDGCSVCQPVRDAAVSL